MFNTFRRITPNDVQQAWNNLKRIDATYGSDVTTRRGADRVLTDLMAMAENNDVTQVGVELRHPGGQVLLRYVQDLPGAGLVTTPQIDVPRTVDHSLLVRGGRNIASYRQPLRMGWRHTAKRAEPPADTLNVGAGTQVRVAPTARKRLVVTKSGARGFAFGEVVGGNGASVFLGPNEAPVGFRFTPGQRLTAVVVRIPDPKPGATDLQGWVIRPDC